MNRNLLEKLIHWPKPYLTRIELGLLVDRSTDACDAIIRRAIQAGYLQRLRRGLYLITSKTGAARPDPREIAQLVYGPSYLSFESALSWHGWIPEGVTVLTCATTKQSKEITTSIGTFTYEHIPAAAFSFGVRHIQTETGSFLMADAWKALADLIYVRHHEWPDIQHISEDLRIELEDFVDSDLALLSALANRYPSRRTRQLLHRYHQELSL